MNFPERTRSVVCCCRIWGDVWSEEKKEASAGEKSVSLFEKILGGSERASDALNDSRRNVRQKKKTNNSVERRFARRITLITRAIPDINRSVY